MAEDDFRRWERELGSGARDGAPPGGRGMAVAAVLTVTGCAALIALGEVRFGVAGLVLASVILLLWRIGM